MSYAPNPIFTPLKKKLACQSDDDLRQRMEEAMARCEVAYAHARAAREASEKACREVRELVRRIAERCNEVRQ